MIAHTLDAALAAPSLDRVIVSTEDDEIAEVAAQFGAEVPFMRPRELAQDETLPIPVLIHAVEWLRERQAYEPDCVLLLQPTSPFRIVEDIESAIQIMIEKNADAVVSVGPVHQHPHWMKRVGEDGRLLDFWTGEIRFRRQELQTLYALNGAIYLVSTRVLLAHRTFYTPRTYAYVMPTERSLDIECGWDFHVAELLVADRLGRIKIGTL